MEMVSVIVGTMEKLLRVYGFGMASGSARASLEKELKVKVIGAAS
jgi:hypothetical protein